MLYTTLISSAELESRLHDATLVIVDCRSALDDKEWGRREYEARHIAGAVFADLDADLAGPKTGTNGRHPLPDTDALRRTFSSLGIARGVQVVAYDQDAGMYAARLWWLLKYMGHGDVAVLDGGFAKWTAENRPTESGANGGATREFAGAPRPEMVADANTVARRAADPAWRVIDARAPERYRGEVEPIDRVAGHIPGAKNHFYKTNMASDGSYRRPSELRASFESTLGGVTPDRVIAYCGSGVTACHNLLALEHAGLTGARLYPGSWSEWSSDATRPVAKGGD